MECGEVLAEVLNQPGRFFVHADVIPTPNLDGLPQNSAEVDVDEPVEARFLPRDAKRPAPESVGDPVLDPDEPDEIVDGGIDLGALAAEFLTLALDPYPRKPGSAFAPPVAPGDDGTPFARLKPTSARDEPD